MDIIGIKRVTINDLGALQEIATETFKETFGSDNTVSDMTNYVRDNFNLKQLHSEIENEESYFYFALQGKRPVGYLKLNVGDAQTEPISKNSLEIERIYVKKEYQGMKIGKLLFERAIEKAKQLNASQVWLGVWEENTSAIQFYKKQGFVEFDKHIFVLGEDEQTDILMNLNLTHM